MVRRFQSSKWPNCIRQFPNPKHRRSGTKSSRKQSLFSTRLFCSLQPHSSSTWQQEVHSIQHTRRSLRIPKDAIRTEDCSINIQQICGNGHVRNITRPHRNIPGWHAPVHPRCPTTPDSTRRDTTKTQRSRINAEAIQNLPIPNQGTIPGTYAVRKRNRNGTGLPAQNPDLAITKKQERADTHARTIWVLQSVHTKVCTTNKQHECSKRRKNRIQLDKRKGKGFPGSQDTVQNHEW